MRKVFVFLLATVLAVALSLVPVTVSSAQTVNAGASYTVQPGDTLYQIGLYYGLTGFAR